MGFGGPLIILFWIAVIAGLVVLVKFVLDQSSRGSRDKSPLQILQERYARGEINRDEYEQKRRDLEPPA